MVAMVGRILRLLGWAIIIGDLVIILILVVQRSI